jgi:hypothetical protein
LNAAAGVDKNWYSRRNLAKFIQLSESGGPNSYLSAIEEMQFWNCFTGKPVLCDLVLFEFILGAL